MLRTCFLSVSSSTSRLFHVGNIDSHAHLPPRLLNSDRNQLLCRACLDCQHYLLSDSHPLVSDFVFVIGFAYYVFSDTIASGTVIVVDTGLHVFVAAARVDLIIIVVGLVFYVSFDSERIARAVNALCFMFVVVVASAILDGATKC